MAGVPNSGLPETGLIDRVSLDCPGAREVGFEIPARYNASEVLFSNLTNGHGENVALHSHDGTLTCEQLCVLANRCGNALKNQSLAPAARIMMLLDDTPVYPAAIFGALRAGFVPVLINTLSTSDLVGYYLADGEAEIAVVESDLCHLVTRDAVHETKLRLLIVANGPVPEDLPVEAISWDDFGSRARAGS